MKMYLYISLIFALFPGIINDYGAEGDKHYDEGIKYQNSGLSEKAYDSFMRAVDKYEKALESDSDKALINHKIGQSYYQIRYWRKAIEYFTRAAGISPENTDYRISLGYAYWKNMMFRESEEVFDRVYGRTGLDAAQLDRLGFGYFKCNDIAKSIELFERAVSLEPEKGSYHSNLAYALQMESYFSRDKKENRIIEEYEKCIELTPGYLYNYVRYGLYMEARKRYYEALQIYEKGLKENPGYYILYYYRNRLKLKYSGNAQARNEIIREINKLQRENEQATHLLESVSFMYSMLENREKERGVNALLMEKFPHSRIGENVLYNYFLMESVPEEKVRLAETYLNKYPFAADGYLQSIYLSLFSMATGDPAYHKNVLEWGKHMIRYTHSREHVVYRDFVRNLVNRGIFLTGAIETGKEGIDVIRSKTLKYRPNRYNDKEWEEILNGSILEIKECMGRAYLLRGDFTNALNILLEVEQEKDRDKRLLYRIGEIYEQTGDIDKAITYYVRSSLKKGRLQENLSEKIKDLYLKKYENLDGLAPFTGMVKRHEEEKLLRKLSRKKLNREIQDLHLEYTGDGFMQLSRFKGKVIILYCWVTSNEVCGREMVKIQELFGNKSDIVLTGVNFDINKGKVIPFLKRCNISFPVVFGDRDFSELQINKFPALMIIDREGRIQYKMENYLRYSDSPELITLLLKTLEY